MPGGRSHGRRRCAAPPRQGPSAFQATPSRKQPASGPAGSTVHRPILACWSHHDRVLCSACPAPSSCSTTWTQLHPQEIYKKPTGNLRPPASVPSDSSTHNTTCALHSTPLHTPDPAGPVLSPTSSHNTTCALPPSPNSVQNSALQLTSPQSPGPLHTAYLATP